MQHQKKELIRCGNLQAGAKNQFLEEPTDSL